MPAEPKSNRNASELTVPNGSELKNPPTGKGANDARWSAGGTLDPKGRPPVMHDGRLFDLATRMADKLGRAPKIEELIAEAGGCQRQRASRVLRRQREQMAARSVQSLIELPAELESEMRRWIDRWKAISAQQLASEHARLEDRHEAQRDADQDLIGELQITLHDVREKLANQTRLTSELVAVNRQIEEKAARLLAERDIARALADDRMAIINQLKN
jgi:hypothetical protein